MPTYSEYEGNGVMANGIFPQTSDVELSASDQLMLVSGTGSTTDSHAPIDPYFWHGGMRPDPVQPRIRPRQITEKERYRETPY